MNVIEWLRTLLVAAVAIPPAALMRPSEARVPNAVTCDDSKAVPTIAQIRAMPTQALYEWWQLSRRAGDTAATAKILGNKVPPCVQALWDRQLDFERELKFR